MKTFQDSSAWTKLLLCIFVPSLIMCLYICIEGIFSKLVGITKTDMETNKALVMTLQTVSSVVIFIGGSIATALLISNKPFKYLNADRFFGGKNGVPHKVVWISCGMLLTSLPLVGLTETLNKLITLPESLEWIQFLIEEMEDQAQIITELMVTGPDFGSLLLAIFVMAIIPGICEELYFRGLLQNTIGNVTHSRHIAVWVTAAIFSFIHFQFLGFIPRMLLGVVLGYILMYSGSVWVNATAHALNNSLAVIVLWFTVNFPAVESSTISQLESMSVDVETIIVASISTVIFAYLFYLLIKNQYKGNMEKRNVAIVCGGYSSEFGVSLRSAQGIKSFIDPERYNTTIVVIEKERWYAKPTENEEFDIDKNDFSYTDAKAVKHTFDFAYITIHGTPGENGILQGYFELIGLKYSCCGPLAASVSFNKFVCNRYLEAFGAKIAKSVLLRKGDKYNVADIEAKLGLPMFVKSNVGGSSFGVTKVKESSQIEGAIKRAFEEGEEVIIESFLKGTELTCGMYKTKEKTVVFPLTEVVSANEFFDYDAKYNGQVQEITPARISVELTKEIQEQTAKYYSILGCKGIVRIDYIITEDGVPHILEANTTPGMTATSFVPQQVRAAGLDIKDVMTEIIENELN